MWGYLGIITAYILIATMLLWLFINSKTYLAIKIVAVPLVLWYGLVLYHTPGNLMGWPKKIESVEDLPRDAFVVGVSIKEPSKKTSDPGGIFITIVETNSDTEVHFTLNPKAAFTYDGSGKPRIYEIPYTKKLHKQMIEMQKAKDGTPGASVKTKKKAVKRKKQEGTVGDETSRDKEMFRIVNPIILMPKDQQ